MKSKEHGLNDVAFTKDQNGCISVITYKGNEYQELQKVEDMWEFSWLKSDEKNRNHFFFAENKLYFPMYLLLILYAMLQIECRVESFKK